jgi:hypothetical protein
MSIAAIFLSLSPKTVFNPCTVLSIIHTQFVFPGYSRILAELCLRPGVYINYAE